jgi:hypothetical protein
VEKQATCAALLAVADEAVKQASTVAAATANIAQPIWLRR